MPTALKVGRAEILECAPLSIRASDPGVADGGWGTPWIWRSRMSYDAEAERMAARSEDTVEGPRAFAEKRKPNWKAR